MQMAPDTRVFHKMHRFALFAAIFTASCLSMVFIDHLLGPKAEFLNAYSVLERLLGREASIADSMIASKFGDLAELVAVIGANLLLGVILTSAVKMRSGRT